MLDDWKVLPRLMMLAVTILTYQAVHWFMNIPHDQTNAYNAGTVTSDKVVHEEKYDNR
jgi:hypothetical protein